LAPKKLRLRGSSEGSSFRRTLKTRHLAGQNFFRCWAKLLKLRFSTTVIVQAAFVRAEPLGLEFSLFSAYFHIFSASSAVLYSTVQ
jgi:hypothetical protein